MDVFLGRHQSSMLVGFTKIIFKKINKNKNKKEEEEEGKRN